MNRRLISMGICLAFLVAGFNVVFGKKKPEKPALDQFEANISPPMGNFSTISIVLEEYSTPEEVHGLADIFAKGKQDALDNALGKMKKGFFRYGGAMGMPIMMVEQKTEPGFRRLTIAGKALDTVNTEFGGQTIIGHRGYPYTCIEIDVNDQGQGKGTLIPFANLVFNQAGRIVAKPMSSLSGNSQAVQLLKVHSVK